MPFLSPKFANDIFLSYARVDNIATKPDNRWVDFFKKSLEIELSKLIGELSVIHIWMDTRELDSNQYFDDVIKEEIRRSAIFLALTSHGYLRTDSYCRKELQEFYSHAQQPPESLRLGTRSRIFNGLLYNIPFGEWPMEFNGIGEAKLYDTTEDESGIPSPVYGNLLGSQIRDLAREIFTLLREYRGTFAQPAPPPPLPDAPKVFVADTVESLKDVRDCVLKRLEKEGIQVFPRIPPPYELAEHDYKATKYIREADLSIHLFDATPGEKYVDAHSGTTFMRRQAELAREHAKSQFIWLPPKSVVDIPLIKDYSYRDFLIKLENGQRDKAHYTFQREPADIVSDEIIKRLGGLKQENPPTGLAALLETHRKDQLHALDLYPLLLKKALQPYINPDSDDPGENFHSLEEYVTQVSVLIIIFGVVASEWVRERLNASLQLAGTAEPRRLKLCGIYAPPGVGDAERQVNLGRFPGSIPIVFFSDPQVLAFLLDRILGGSQ